MFEHADKFFLVLLKVLSDSSDEVVQQDLEVLAEIVSYQDKNHKEPSEEKFPTMVINKYFPEFIHHLLSLFSTNKRLLEERGSFIIRQIIFKFYLISKLNYFKLYCIHNANILIFFMQAAMHPFKFRSYLQSIF